MKKLEAQLFVAPLAGGFGVRMRLKGTSCPAVWAGQGWNSETRAPANAILADKGRGWIFSTHEEATTYMDTLRAEQQDGEA